MSRVVRTLAVATIATAAALLLTLPDPGPACFEDEAVLWDGEGHTVCVPLDVLTERGD